VQKKNVEISENSARVSGGALMKERRKEERGRTKQKEEKLNPSEVDMILHSWIRRGLQSTCGEGK